MQPSLAKLPNKGSIAALALFLLSCAYLISCKSETSDDIVITGDLLSASSIVEGKTLYFGDNSTRDFLDSAIVSDGKFRFRIKPDKGFIPLKASILYATGDPKWPYQLMGFKNPYFAKTQESNFLADRGEMHLRRDTTLKVTGRDLVSFIIENPNKQTQAAFRHLAFHKNPEQSAENRKLNVALVKKYPYSVSLLSELEWSKKDIGENELAELVTLFEPSLQATPYFRNINLYLKADNITGDKFPEISLRKPDNTASSDIINKKAEYNLVVFWASWCLPCRKEIPQLKTLHAKYKDRVTITSISTDRAFDSWKKALKQEEMPWNQFIVDEKTMAVLDKKYNLQSIPLSLLFDRKNNLIQRKLGYGIKEESVDAIVEFYLLGD